MGHEVVLYLELPGYYMVVLFAALTTDGDRKMAGLFERFYIYIHTLAINTGLRFDLI